ncbi:type II toxin-antitoxin system HipA family toxin [Andreprevotia chitinilytica]|uniref:type II toxin-antitoxin system HipA family toxin n=1 Tax=Andreprevotia chitinilytica TaxID=396808 RepID=UPI00054F40B9|nr:HipA domain-containing protein [Andreprevotia chitinilytica]
MDLFGVIWTRHQGIPTKLADMVLTSTELRITRHAAGMDCPGFSMLHDVAGLAEWNWARSQDQELPPQLQALLPPQDPHSPMRRLMYRLLEAKGVQRIGRQPIEQEWLLLTHFGAGGIGHLDVFADDLSAQAYYARPEPVLGDLTQASALWACLREGLVNQTDADSAAELMAQMQVTGVSGMIPKVFTSLGDAASQVLVKVEPPEYPRVLSVEALALELHRKAGLDVPDWRYREFAFGDELLSALVLDRYDRDNDHHPIPQESFYTLLRTGNRSKYYERTDGAMETLFTVVNTPGLVANPFEVKYGIFQRFVMALATGNGDLHSDNFALIGRAGEARLAPVFDPAPMRAYRFFRKNHDILSALQFSGIGGVDQQHPDGTPLDYTSSGQVPPDLRERVLALARVAGIRPSRATKWIKTALHVTEGFSEQACDLLSKAPAADRQRNRPAVDGFRATVEAMRSALREASGSP